MIEITLHFASGSSRPIRIGQAPNCEPGLGLYINGMATALLQFPPSGPNQWDGSPVKGLCTIDYYRGGETKRGFVRPEDAELIRTALAANAERRMIAKAQAKAAYEDRKGRGLTLGHDD